MNSTPYKREMIEYEQPLWLHMFCGQTDKFEARAGVKRRRRRSKTRESEAASRNVLGEDSAEEADLIRKDVAVVQDDLKGPDSPLTAYPKDDQLEYQRGAAQGTITLRQRCGRSANDVLGAMRSTRRQSATLRPGVCLSPSSSFALLFLIILVGQESITEVQTFALQIVAYTQQAHLCSHAAQPILELRACFCCVLLSSLPPPPSASPKRNPTDRASGEISAPALALALFGYAAGVTGGGSVTTQTPSSAAELKSWLEDSVTRRIVLKQMYDFNSVVGTETGTVCFPYTCTNNAQGMISGNNNFCAQYTNKTTATYSAAGGKFIMIKSNKSILGTGANTGFIGVGIKFANGAGNIIIQNVRFENLNPRWVWGGDFLNFDGSGPVWIDHCYFNRVGRQFIVSGFNPNTFTISNSYFDGQADFTPFCDGYHYWAFLLVGTGDKITFANNHIFHVGARTTGHTLESDDGNILFEGNYFQNVVTNSGSIAGKAYWVSSGNAASCASSLGRTCQSNTFSNSGTGTLADSAVMSAMSGDSVIRGAKVMAASAVPSFVSANAGTGKVIA
ncbi:pectin lyase fold/virulence factor [Mycena rebaudengoi]|nr:pectin lyase fold/virulence factor [Mycena rebaudengoi]